MAAHMMDEMIYMVYLLILLEMILGCLRSVALLLLREIDAVEMMTELRVMFVRLLVWMMVPSLSHDSVVV